MSEEKEWHDFPTMPNLTILPWLGWGIVIGLLVAGLFYASKAMAEPIFVAQSDSVKITLYSDPCELKDTVTNLPYKAVWLENGQEVQGCWGPVPRLRVAQFYFADKTVFPVGFHELTKVQGA